MPILLLLLAALLFGLYNVFIKLSSDHIQPVLGAVVLQFVAAFLGSGLLYYLYRTGTTLHVTARGVWLAVAAGAAIGLVEILTFMVFARGVPVAVGNPLIIGGSLIVTAAIGLVALREVLNPVQMLATGLIIAGVGLLALGAARGGAA